MIVEVGIAVGIIVVLILLNGLFVAAEFSLVMAPRAAIEHLAEEGHRAASSLHKILTNARLQDRSIATAQLGITLASLGLGMYGEHALAGWIGLGLERMGTPSWIGAHTAASVVSIAILTYLHIVLGEMVPKSLALQRPETTALWLIRPVQWTQWLAFPLVLLLAGLGNGVLRLFGIRRQSAGHDRFYTTEELQYVVRESQKGGLLRAESGRVLNDLLEFGEITAGEVMVPRTKAVGLPKGAPPAELKRVIRSSRHTRVSCLRAGSRPYPGRGPFEGSVSDAAGRQTADVRGHKARPASSRGPDARPRLGIHAPRRGTDGGRDG